MKKRNFVLIIALFLVAFLGLSANGIKAEASYSYQSHKITKVGDSSFQQKRNQLIKITFVAPKSGVYYMMVKDGKNNSSNTAAAIGFEKNVWRSIIEEESNTNATAYMMKGKKYTIYVGVGRMSGNHLQTTEGSVLFRIKTLKNRVQKIKENKTVTFSTKDARLPSTWNLAVDENTPDNVFDKIDYTDEAYVTFTPKKTGWYRCYYVQCWTNKLSMYDSFNYYMENNNSLRQCESKDVIKLQKGKTYNFAIGSIGGNIQSAKAKYKMGMQYLKTKRTIALHCNYPDGDYKENYVVQKGKKLGTLLVPSNTTEYKGKKYKFAGWYTKAKGGRKITANSKNCAKIKKLYAHWKKV